jgi:hypothetical protein
VFLGASTKIVDRDTGETFIGEVPEYAVVVPGNRTVTLQVNDKTSGYIKVASYKVGANGALTMRWKPTKRGKYWVRAYVSGDHRADTASTYVKVIAVK